MISIDTGVFGRIFLGAMTAVIGFQHVRNRGNDSLREKLFQLTAEHPTADYGYDEKVLKGFLCQMFDTHSHHGRNRTRCIMTDSALREKADWCEFIPATEKAANMYNICCSSGKVLLVNAALAYPQIALDEVKD